MEQTYADLTVEQLKDELSSRDLAVSGTKQELIDRLYADDAAPEAASAETSNPDKEALDANQRDPGIDRSGQYPGAGDPQTAHDTAAGRTEEGANAR